MFSEVSAKKIAIISALTFGCFIIVFFALNIFSRLGFINIEIRSVKLQTLIASLLFLPFISALFFTGQVAKYKNGNFQNVYKILTFVSIGLLAFGILQMVLAIIGVFG